MFTFPAVLQLQVLVAIFSLIINSTVGVTSNDHGSSDVGQGLINATIISNNSSPISRDHVTIFFDHRVRYHTHEVDNAYSKEELAVMVNLLSKRFDKILIDTAPKLEKLPPDEHAPSRVWIPSVVGQHNSKHPNSSAMEVIVSFEFDVDIYTNQDPNGDLYFEETSFHVARYMADEANHLHPGTVTTLMMTMYHTEKLEYADESQDYSYWQYVRDWHGHDDTDLLIYVERIYHLAWPYHLGLFMDIHDCGRYRGPLPSKVKEILPYFEVIALFIDPTTFHHLTTLSPGETQKMFVVKFEDCERKLQEERKGIKVMPSTLWKSNHITISGMVEEWKAMSKWAVENDKEVIMYEAFDTPGGRDFYYWGHGWWRLRDRMAYHINETSFVEKIEDATSSIYTKQLYSSMEDSSSSEEEIYKDIHGNSNLLPSASGDKNCIKNSTDHPTTPSSSASSQLAPPTVISYQPHAPPPPHTIIHATTSSNHGLYVVLVLLSVMCTILVVTQVYFYSKVMRDGAYQRQGGHGILYKRDNQEGNQFVNPGLSLIGGRGFEGIDEHSSGSLINQHYRSPPTNQRNSEGNGGINFEDRDDGGVASINGSVLEMTSDTTPIVSVAYKKL